MKVIGAIVLLLHILCAPALCWQGRTKTVHDGDSISVYGPEDIVVNVRLYGIDAPESKQAFGYQARQRLSKLVSRKTLEVTPIDTDRYGRTVALVHLKDGTFVNEVLVADGLAWVYDQYCHMDFCQGFTQLQEQARQERKGLWAESDAMQPSEWRKEHKSEEWYKAPVRAIKSLSRKIVRVFK